jgi:uncharacterized phage protein gp47/JayE
MTSLSPVVGPSGISSPDFPTILSALQASFLSIYGSDAVLTPDSQDGQFLAVLAQAIFDQGQALIAVFNSFSPATAQGAGLSSVVQINGLARDVSTSSTASVTIVGQANSIITNGQVGDNLGLGTVWNLPASVTIPSGGSITVTATSATTGATAAAAGTLTQILTPTLGWQSVTNAAAAIVGAPVETDAALRQRQAVSTAIAAQTPVNSILAAVANIPGVSNALVIQNATDVTDANGNPPHSIAVIVAGGNPTTIAETIAATKPPGIQTVGTTNVVVLDSNGVPNTINFFVQTQTSIFGSITLVPDGNFNPSTSELIVGAVVEYINSLGGNQNVLVGKLFSPANLNGDAATGSSGLTQQQLDSLSATYNIPITGIQIGLSSGALSTADIILSVFTEPETLAANWTVTT